MANAVGLINEGLWRRDREFQRLPRLAQCTFCQVLSQKDLDTAGVLTLNLELLAKACDELSVDQLRADLTILEERRFLFVDYDTDELLVRSYVRLVSAKSGSKGKSLAWQSVPKNARLLGSEKLRHELAVELRRVRWQEADALAAEIDPLQGLSEAPSKPPSSPSENQSPLEAPSKGQSQVPVPDLVSRSVVGHLGEPPSPFCPEHPNDTEESCIPCMRTRRTYPERKAEWDRNEAARRRATEAATAAAIKACGVCDPYGDIELLDDRGNTATRKCNHQEAAHG